MKKTISNISYLCAFLVSYTAQAIPWAILPQPAIAQDQRCGVKNGIPLPCWTEFLEDGEGEETLPLYPYAKRPNGCSIPGGRPGEYDNFGSLGYNFSFREACNRHDRCYYTLGTTPGQCNIPYAQELLQVCKDGIFQPLKPQDVVSSGKSRATAIANCEIRAEWMSKAVIAGQSKYHQEAQEKQARYLRKVDDFLIARRGQVLPTTVQDVELQPRYAGIAISPSGDYYYGWNDTNKQALESRLISKCGSNCKSFFTSNFGINRMYLALVQASDNAWATRANPSINNAVQEALSSCREVSRDPDSCQLDVVISPKQGVVRRSEPVPRVEQKTCFSVDARQGWQSFVLPRTINSPESIEGGWSVDARSYSTVNHLGHQGAEAERLAPYNDYKYDQRFPFGALLMSVSNRDTIWIQTTDYIVDWNTSFPVGSVVRFRINDTDAALGDNAGSLNICLHKAAG
ncbi:DUF4189 domain-containing protein [Aliterella atlantica]|uniref:DUF4189 domain-containing protein n=1 Tax=Aliterella atlantica CENA595 TaxID=1618023 RepID=A0A0D8ZMT1_9CYAN|nr:DUF4189 domain-containing protein [Aliterella atlantica]KJH69657.1 hypothetical protein UH38_22790 [Aliterella atlantica CENA595]